MQKINVYLSRIGKRWTMLICAAVIASLNTGCGEKKTRVHRVGSLSGLDFAIAITEGFKSEMTGFGVNKNFVDKIFIQYPPGPPRAEPFF